MRTHWFFDFDGTLCDTEADIKAAWRAALRNLGRECPQFDRVYRTGPTLEQVAYMLFEDATPALVDAIKEQFRTCYDGSDFPSTRPYKWVPAWLADLKRQGCRIYIATNKRWNPTRILVKKLGWDVLFDGCYSFDSFLDPDVAAAHPGAPRRALTKAELLSEAMRIRGIDRADAVMVGDTKGDVSSGAAAGMHTIGCTWGYGAREELEGADEIYEAARFA
ncbi:MAG: HAD hydrolase-like protein [Kiritimatiellae bacterium]|nr:HAD hydrolase-like protein [Kiritimatiellia bacterium]